MKKITSYALSLAFLAVGIASCAKSTKGKTSNEWKVVSYVKNESFTNNGGSSGTTDMTMTETVYKQQFTSTSGGNTVTDSHTGTVNTHELSIKKDGTWSLKEDLSHDYGDGSDVRNITEQTGTWTFVGKTKGDDFRKNERLLFNILTEKKTSTYKNSQMIISQYVSDDTYLTGENVLIYTIKESKKDEMQLELVNDVAVTSDYGGTPGTNTSKLSVRMTLKEK